MLLLTLRTTSLKPQLPFYLSFLPVTKSGTLDPSHAFTFAATATGAPQQYASPVTVSPHVPPAIDGTSDVKTRSPSTATGLVAHRAVVNSLTRQSAGAELS